MWRLRGRAWVRVECVRVCAKDNHSRHLSLGEVYAKCNPSLVTATTHKYGCPVYCFRVSFFAGVGTERAAVLINTRHFSSFLLASLKGSSPVLGSGPVVRNLRRSVDVGEDSEDAAGLNRCFLLGIMQY